MEENQDAVKVLRAVRDFSDEIQKRIDPAYELESNVSIETLCGPLPVLLRAVRPGWSVGFDFLGGDTTPIQSDDFRDGLLLGSGQLQVIYRMRARDVLAHLNDILYGVSLWEPRLFTDRGRDIVERNSSPRMNDLVREVGWPLPFGRDDSIQSFFDYPEGGGHTLIMERRRFRPDGRDDWSMCFRFANDFGGGSLEEVKAAWARQYERDDGIDL